MRNFSLRRDVFVCISARAGWFTTAAALMASPSAGSSRDAGAPPPVSGDAPSNISGAPVDTTQLDTLCEKAITAGQCGRHALEAGFYRRAADEARRLQGDTFACTFLTLQRAGALRCQLQLEGVTQEEKAALHAEAWALASSCLPLIVRRMDANTMLPGRGTAVELAFSKRFEVITSATLDSPLPTRMLQLACLSLGYATAVLAADVLVGTLCVLHDSEAEAFVLGVMDSMLLAARSLAAITLAEEIKFAYKYDESGEGPGSGAPRSATPS